MKKSRIITFAIGGGILGFSIHLLWHLSAGVNLFFFGSHVTQGTLYTLVGVIIGRVLHSIIPEK